MAKISGAIISYLEFLMARATGEEQARIQWWIARIRILAEQEPKAKPLPVEVEG